MKCTKCSSEYEGDFCPNCVGNTESTNIQNTQDLQKNIKAKKLLGFRSNKVVNKIISIGYMIVCALVLIGVLGTEKYANITNYDYTISQICDSLIVVMMITPYIFLSNFKYRDKLPLFKNHTVKSNIIGMLIVITILGVISGILDANHSKEFLADMDNHDWKETVTEATCEKAGEKLKQCQYCGIKETEEIPKLKHEKEEISKIEPTCEKQGEITSKCKLCSKEFKEVLKATGHKFKEISRKEATETAEGEIIKECSVCKKQKTTVIKKLEKEENKEEKPAKAEENNSSNKSSSKKETSSKKTTSKTESKASEKANVSSEAVKVKTPEEVRENFINSCISIEFEPDYEAILRNPSEYEGKNLKFEGIVVSVSEPFFSDYTTYIIRLTNYNDENLRGLFYVKYILKDNETRILENDIVQIYGECLGLTEYINLRNESVTVPCVEAKYIDFITY